MRGKESHARRKRQAHGITPACAGKSEKIDLITMYRRDHPRMCGEKARSRAMPTSAIGSPPHVRGKVGVTDIAPVSPRITPACAGKSTICGEWQQTFGGSPPHVRGKDMDTLQTVHDARITPACAGKRTPFSLALTLCRDHPRMCGEKLIVFTFPHFGKGSPPHVRGKAC